MTVGMHAGMTFLKHAGIIIRVAHDGLHVNQGRKMKNFIRIFLMLFSAFAACYFIETGFASPLPGMPPVNDPNNIYADANASNLSSPARRALKRVYVPNTEDNTVSVIDPDRYKVIKTFHTGNDPEHVVPAYDLKTLWVLNDLGNSITPINPFTGIPGKKIHVRNPYNLYFTPNGKFAIVLADEWQRLDFRNPHTMALYQSIPVKCGGINHMDFTADGRYAIASCQYSGMLVKLDVVHRKILDYLPLKLKHSKQSANPQDVRSSPDGRTFYVADMKLNGVFLIDPNAFRQIGFIATGIGTHSIYPSRDGRLMYISNRGCNHMFKCPKKGPGSLTVLDPSTQTIVAQWKIPGGGSPDMGNLSTDGKELWLSGKFDHEVYVFDTKTGKLKHRISVGHFPHGLAFWPEPGRYSLGHTGNMR